MKKVLSIVLAIMSLFAFTGFVRDAEKGDRPVRQEAPAEKVLRVGADLSAPPFAYYQQASKTCIGFDVELMRGLAGSMGYDRVEFVPADSNNLLPSLQNGKVDAAIFSRNVTDEQRRAVDFTEPYLERSGVAIALSGTEVQSAEDMRDKRIAVEAGSAYAKHANQYSDAVILCGNAEEALKMVLEQKADFAVMDNYIARFYITYFFKDKLNLAAELPGDTETGVGIAVAKGNQEMLDKLNTALQNYRGTAAYYQTKRSYFGRLEE